jgi:sulfatase maturation enzyme AslB (radical SAM superfamily)
MVKFMGNQSRNFTKYLLSLMKNESLSSCSAPSLSWKLWIYTNYDCNLRCSYCVAKSSPNAPRRALGLENVKQLVDEAVDLGFSEVFLTGGEPFILKDIYEMISYSSERLPTIVLTNGMLFTKSRLEKLSAVANGNLVLQVSLDGGNAEDHDAYRGRGTWVKTVSGIRTLLERSYTVRLSTTETPANTDRLDEICEFRHQLGISEEDHFIRPLAKRGYSQDGLDVGIVNLVPEVTVNVDGVYWHPLSTDADMQVCKDIFPLSAAVDQIKEQLDIISRTGEAGMTTFT